MIDFSCFARLVKNEFVTNYALNIYLYMYVKYIKENEFIYKYLQQVTILNGTIQAQRLSIDSCRSPCVDYTSCKNCTESDCIWCQNEKRCVDKNAYPASFPYGQCREWTTVDSKCHPTETGKEWCTFYSSCSACRSDPGCGWCDDGSGTGKGLCLPGGARGPSTKSLDTCSIERWYFTKCPSKCIMIK